MDINKFIETIKKKYGKIGVTSVEISFGKNRCDILLMRNEGFKPHPDTTYIGVEPEPESPLPFCYAHCMFEMPLDETKVLEQIDSWINTDDTPEELDGYARFSYKEQMKHEDTPIWE